MKILYFGAIDWYFLTQRPQHLARGLARLGHDVVYVYPRSFLGTWWRRRELPDRALEAWRDDIDPSLPNLHLYEPGFVGQLRGSIIREVNRRLFRNGLIAQLARRKLRPDWIWIGHPRQLEYTEWFPEIPVIYDCMDEWRYFPDPEGSAERERRLFERSSVVLTSSRPIQERVSAAHPRAHLVPNGVELDHFQPVIGLRSRSGVGAVSRRPRAVTMGTLGAWLHFPIIQEVARRLPGWDFELIGPWGEDVTEAARPSGPNIHARGRQPYESLPEFLSRADVAFMAFRNDALTQGVDPVKAYEFLAAGLPVVSVPMPELEKFTAGIRFAPDAAAFAAALEETRTEFADDTRRRRLSETMREHDWSERARRAASHIEEAGGNR